MKAIVSMCGCLALAAAGAVAAPNGGIIPAPQQLAMQPGAFHLDGTAKIFCSQGAESEAHFLQAGLKARDAVELTVTLWTGAQTQGIELQLLPAETNSPESYTLKVTPEHIVLRAGSTAGLFYGVQSLLQMVDRPDPATPPAIPAASITDAPRFAWRGLMLDESRHFFGKPTVLETLDIMASLKLNRFHWHLTDEPGWRLESKRFPNLTTIGSRGNWSDPEAPAAGYTQADIREIVEYARQRHIVIVPEIDMPGHATAATRAYPEISGGGAGKWAGFTFNPAREQTYAFLGDVLQETAALFPGPYLHIGGDEVHYGNQSWSTDPAILQFCREQGLTNATELERYFVRRMAGAVRQLGKTAVGWDEIGAAGVPPDQAVVMWWRQDKPGVLQDLLNRNYRVVLCPRLPCYFDFVQAANHQVGRRWQGRFNDLADVYAFPDATVSGVIPPGHQTGVLGVEACVWTEQIQNPSRLAFMMYPRLAALAEAAWTPAAAKHAAGFTQRLPGFLRELDRRKIPYYNPFDPGKTPEPPGPGKPATGTANG